MSSAHMVKSYLRSPEDSGKSYQIWFQGVNYLGAAGRTRMLLRYRTVVPSEGVHKLRHSSRNGSAWPVHDCSSSRDLDDFEHKLEYQERNHMQGRSSLQICLCRHPLFEYINFWEPHYLVSVGLVLIFSGSERYKYYKIKPNPEPASSALYLRAWRTLTAGERSRKGFWGSSGTSRGNTRFSNCGWSCLV